MENSSQNNGEDKVIATLSDEAGKVEKKETSLLKSPWVKSGGLVALVLIIAGGFLYFQSSTTRVKIDTSIISAPIIGLSPSAAAQLNETYVNVGDYVAQNTPVARVGDEVLKTKTAGQIVDVQNDIGKTFSPGQAVVSMVDPSQLRVVGTIDENKGLEKIHVGQLVSFSVDAYGSKTYSGVVDEVSPTSHQSDVVFNISDQRPTQQFDIKVRFNPDAYPELKNGMSAKLTIFTK